MNNRLFVATVLAISAALTAGILVTACGGTDATSAASSTPSFLVFVVV
jgi:hypothetical protein